MRNRVHHKSSMSKQILKEALLRILGFYFGKKRNSVILLIFIMILIGLTPSVDSILLQYVTDFIAEDHSNVDSFIFEALKWVLVYTLWNEVSNIVWRIYDYIYLKTMPILKAQLIDSVYQYVQYHDYDFFQKNLAGSISSRITDAAKNLEFFFYYSTEKIVRRVSMLIFALVTLYYVHHMVALIFFVWFVVFIMLSIYFAPAINKYALEYGYSRSKVAGRIVDAVSNNYAIRMFSRHKYERKYLNSYVDMSAKKEQDMQWFLLKIHYLLGVLTSVMVFGIVYYVLSLHNTDQISIGDCVLAITLCVAIIDDVWDLTQEFGDLFEELGSFSQIISLFSDYSVKEVKNPDTLKIIVPKIEFCDVSFFYKKNDNIFNNQSIIIEPYQRIGLVGRSGSGKTTFTRLISRMYDVESGEILIDGQDIKNVSLNSLRTNISMIPQEPILFHRSIMENIRYGNLNATDEDVIQAAKDANIHNVIINLPEGYDTVCGERGNNLSGGQRQRIVIARAILCNAPILILDEATSALDSETENELQSAFDKLMHNKTVFVIAHRLGTVMHMDRILMFNEGHVIADGTHENLKKHNKYYKKLWDSYNIQI